MTEEKQEINPSDEYNIRLDKLAKLREAKIVVYPSETCADRIDIANALAGFTKLEEAKKDICIAGRIRSIRLHGGSCFIHIEDGSGKMQGYLKKDEVKAKNYELFTDFFDVGDFVELKGSLFITKKGEQTLLVQTFKMLSKALMPLPEKWHGLSDVEIRFRQRYLDLLANKDVKEVFKKRSEVITYIRNYFNKLGFLEVDTPILQPMAG
ncbi:MAG: lysine--tRNA ligase, partial [Candidatus Magasanikbacteria bacterium CG_4_9_14_0_2_um_filter_41_10]